MKRGDVYNMKLLNDNLKSNENNYSIANLYYNGGYVFNEVQPIEVDVEGDSIDLDIRIKEGVQARMNKISIVGNDRV